MLAVIFSPGSGITGCKTTLIPDRVTSNPGNIDATLPSSVVDKDYGEAAMSHDEALAFLNCVSDMTDQEILSQISKKVSRKIAGVSLSNPFWCKY